MEGYTIITETVTQALKGRDLLRKNGCKAQVEKTNSGVRKPGCEYSIRINGGCPRAEQILQNGGVRILEMKKQRA
ncbi:MAG: DUF3343 domain-containing protein [Clostridia bacterium]|nr:DUF3343 domain-containing protein [Clostridia bacterium]